MKGIKDIRLKHYDYQSNGYYFITIVTRLRERFFENRYESVVDHFIKQLNDVSGVKVDYYVVMPDHVHMILILECSDLRVGEVIRRFKALTSRTTGVSLWQPNFYEHVIRDEKSLEKIREYIVHNPDEEEIKWKDIYDGKIPAIKK